MRATLFVAVSSVAASNVRTFGRSHSFLASDMQPEVVARTLVKVEDEWRSQAASFAECNATLSAGSDISECNSAPDAFSKSCSTVVGAVVKASSGDRSHVKEYMGVVCGEVELSGWHQARCAELATSVFDVMSDDNYENRENFNAATLCTSFWSKFTLEEKTRVDTEREVREAAEKKAEEERVEAEKKAAAEAAEDQKQREREEAEKRATESRIEAEQAAADLKTKKEEAEKQAEEAKLKMEEAQAAAEAASRHHKEAVANATRVANVTNQTANVTVPANSSKVVVAKNTTNTTK